MSNSSKLSLLKSDPLLKKLVQLIPTFHFESTNDVFHDLIGCIVEQQIHYRSTKKIFQRLLEKAEIERLNLSNFPAFEEKALPTLKLSMNKLKTIHEWVHFSEKNQLNWQNLTDIEVREKLSSIKGIGPWTIDMILIFTLKRPSIFPVDDFHLKQIMTSLYNLDPNNKLKAQMKEIAELWGDEKSLAVLYLLEWKKNHLKSRT